MLLSYLLLATFTLTACRALPAAYKKADHLDDKDDIIALLRSLATSQDEADNDNIGTVLKMLASSQDAPDEDHVNALLKELAASQDENDGNDDDNNDDLTEIQALFDVMDLVKQGQAKAMQDSDNDDDDGDDENAENQWFLPLLKVGGKHLLKRYGGRYLKRTVMRGIRRAGLRYVRRRFCSEKEVMLQELNDEAGDDDNDDDTFAELQSLFGVLKELKAVTAQDIKGTANAEGWFSNTWKTLRRMIGGKIKTIKKRIC